MTETTLFQRSLSMAVNPTPILLASEIIEQFGLFDLNNLFKAVKQQPQKQDLNVAVLGRFKAGKSSFLNQVIGRALLPVGVLPVTAIVTEIGYATDERAEVVSLDGMTTEIEVSEISRYISEAENPKNIKAVSTVRIFLPSLAQFRGIKFIDTPGLESIFEHNTASALSWSPNVDIAIVAIGVDPPLTHQDMALIENLFKYTPNVTVLLTKIDMLAEPDRKDVENFISSKLHARFGPSISVFPYSIKSEYEALRARFESERIVALLASAQKQRVAIFSRKLTTLFHSIEDFLQLAYKAAAVAESQREELKVAVLGSPQVVSDQKLQLRLLATHSAGKTRLHIQNYLKENAQTMVEDLLKQQLSERLPNWKGSFAKLLATFEAWLRHEMRQQLSTILIEHQNNFIQPLQEFQRQSQQFLQSVRDELSEKVRRVFGMPLRTFEVGVEIQPPHSPDISIGKVFDHTWEIASFLIPMTLVRPAMERRFYTQVENETYKNLSRLTTQWEEKLAIAIADSRQEAEKRLDELTATIEHLLAAYDQPTVSRINLYLERVRETLKFLS